MAARIDREMRELYASVTAVNKTATRLSKKVLTPDDIQALSLIATQSQQAAAEANRIIGTLIHQKHGDA